MENLSSTSGSNSTLELTEQSLAYLESSRKWTLFLSIVGFIFIGLMAIVGLIMLSTFSMMASPFMPVSGFTLFLIYIVVGAVYFFPIFFLYKFSVNMRSAVALRSAEFAEKALKFQKMMYKFMGILTIVALAVYPVIIIAYISRAIGQ